MPKSLLDKIVDKLRNMGSGFKGSAVATCVAFFAYNFAHMAGCGQGLVACSNLQQFGFIFPLYLLVMTFIPILHLNVFTYTTLYILSAVLYSAVIYYAVVLMEKGFEKIKTPPPFTLKRI